MADITQANAEITIGPTKLFLAPTTVGIPTIGTAGAFAAFDPLGATNDGLEADYTATWKDIVVDELMGILSKKLIAHKLMISAKLAQTTIKNMAYAIPGATLAGDGLSLTIGSIDAPEFRLGFEAPAPNGKTRQGIIYRVVSIGALKMHHTRKNWVDFPMQFEGLSDPSQTAPQDLCQIKDF
jgi:hypothetical protein